MVLPSLYQTVFFCNSKLFILSNKWFHVSSNVTSRETLVIWITVVKTHTVKWQKHLKNIFPYGAIQLLPDGAQTRGLII